MPCKNACLGIILYNEMEINKTKLHFSSYLRTSSLLYTFLSVFCVCFFSVLFVDSLVDFMQQIAGCGRVIFATNWYESGPGLGLALALALNDWDTERPKVAQQLALALGCVSTRDWGHLAPLRYYNFMIIYLFKKQCVNLCCRVLFACYEEHFL